MCYAKNPLKGEGKRSSLNHTDELEADYRVWLLDECHHDVFEVHDIVFRNGKKGNFRKQCVNCGHHEGDFIGRDKLPKGHTPPESLVDKHDKYRDRRYADLDVLQGKHFRIQSEQGGLKYDRYLGSDLWKAKRDKVIERARGVCEGCGVRDANQVHHVSYRHIFDEFLWDLVAVCEVCHEKAHTLYPHPFSAAAKL